MSGKGAGISVGEIHIAVEKCSRDRSVAKKVVRSADKRAGRVQLFAQGLSKPLKKLLVGILVGNGFDACIALADLRELYCWTGISIKKVVPLFSLLSTQTFP